MDEAFGRARFTSQLKKKGIDVDKMHSQNVKDAAAAKKRVASSQADLDAYRKKTGVTSEGEMVKAKSADKKPTLVTLPTGKRVVRMMPTQARVEKPIE